jgi:hypothetical protein
LKQLWLSAAKMWLVFLRVFPARNWSDMPLTESITVWPQSWAGLVIT